MAYNNSFPVGYQPYYASYSPTLQAAPIPQNVPQQNPQPVNNSIIWVQGEAGAKSYLVAPNTTVQLWDSEDQVIYLKSADASGMPSMKVLEYKIREANNNGNTPIISDNTAEYVTKDEMRAFEEKIQRQLSKLTLKPKREVDDDE